MKLIRAILIGLVLWFAVFVEVSILMFGLNLTGLIYYVLHYILFSLLVILMSLWYFWHPRIRAGLWPGLVLGIVFVLVSIILDAVITVPFFVGEGYSFMVRGDIVIGELLMIIISSIAGLVKE